MSLISTFFSFFFLSFSNSFFKKKKKKKKKSPEIDSLILLLQSPNYVEHDTYGIFQAIMQVMKPWFESGQKQGEQEVGVCFHFLSFFLSLYDGLNNYCSLESYEKTRNNFWKNYE